MNTEINIDTPEGYLAHFGETSESHEKKEALIGHILYHVRNFLKLKVNNSARVVFQLDLDDELRKTYKHLPGPAIVRLRISRIAGPQDHFVVIDRKPPSHGHFAIWEPGPDGTDDMRCEWRMADAYHEVSSPSISFGELNHTCYGGEQYRRIFSFFEKHYGVDFQPYTNHMPHVRGIRAQIVLREPLGVFAVLEGNSEWVQVEGSNIYAYKGVRFIEAPPAVAEP